MLKNVSWGRGFIRLWIVYGVITTVITVWSVYDASPYIPASSYIYIRSEDNTKIKSGLSEVESYSTSEILKEAARSGKSIRVTVGADDLYFDLNVSKDEMERAAAQHQQQLEKNYNEKLWTRRVDSIYIGGSFLLVPLIFGLAIAWIVKGFKGVPETS